MELIKSNPSNYRIARVSSVTEFNGLIKDIACSVIGRGNNQAIRATLDYKTFSSLSNAEEALDNWKKKSVTFSTPNNSTPKPSRKKRQQIVDQDTPTKETPKPNKKSKREARKKANDSDTEEDEDACKGANLSDEEKSKTPVSPSPSPNPQPYPKTPDANSPSQKPGASKQDSSTKDHNIAPPVYEVPSDDEDDDDLTRKDEGKGSDSESEEGEIDLANDYEEGEVGDEILAHITQTLEDYSTQYPANGNLGMLYPASTLPIVSLTPKLSYTPSYRRGTRGSRSGH